jgi:hypothetical protein
MLTWPMWWIAGGLAGCSDSGFSFARPREVCESTYWAEESAPPSADPLLWTLEEKWHAPLGDAWVVHLAGGPLEDTNGDGTVGPGDRTDPLSAEAVSSKLGVVHGETGEVLAHARTEGSGIVTVAEVDPAHPGAEIVMLGVGGLWVHLADSEGVYLSAPLPDSGNPYGMPLTDLEGDGAPDVVGARGVYSLQTGEALLSFETVEGTPAAADLDGDGLAEVIVHHVKADFATIYDAGGGVAGICEVTGAGGGRGSEDIWSTAVGQLDDDPELEVVVGGLKGVAVCDRDGTRLAERPDPMTGSLLLAELDGDPMPEILVQDGISLLGFEHDLAPMPGANLIATGYASTVADLDGDGVHEVVTWMSEAVAITRATGTPLAYYRLPGAMNMYTWTGSLGPMVADIDGDGLAEIVVAAWAEGGVVALENPLGGWDVPDAIHAWTGTGHHPASRTAAGEVVQLGPDDVTPGRNVWNGRATLPPSCSTALSLDLRDICVDNCAADAALTVYVSNGGVVPIAAGLVLELLVDGEVQTTAPVPEIAPELALPVQIAWPADELGGAIEVRVQQTDQLAACTVPASAWVGDPICSGR